jgi:hypothetical protein
MVEAPVGRFSVAGWWCSRAAPVAPGGRAVVLIVGEVAGAGGQAAGSARILASAVM